MKVQIKILTEPDKNWNKRVLKSGGDIYQTTIYAEFQEKCLGMESEYILVENNSKIVGQLVITYGPRFAKYLRRISKKAYNLSAKHFKIYTFVRGPIIIDKKLKKEIYKCILDYLDKNKHSCFMALDFSLPLNEEKKIQNLFYRKGFYSDSWGTVVIDVRKPLDTLWKSLGKKRRNLIRKGEKYGLIIKEVKEKKDYNKVIKIIGEMSKRNKIFDHDKKYYKNFFKIFWESRGGKTWMAKKDDRILATITTYLLGKKAIQTVVAHSNYCVKNKIPATDFLEWHIIKWAHDNSYKTYDLAGIRPESKDKKDISIRHYKTHWGGREIHYPYFSKKYSKTKFALIELIRTKGKKKLVTRWG